MATIPLRQQDEAIEFQCPLCFAWHHDETLQTYIQTKYHGQIQALGLNEFLDVQSDSSVLYWVDKSKYADGEMFYTLSLTLRSILHMRMEFQVQFPNPCINLITQKEFDTLCHKVKKSNGGHSTIRYISRPLYYHFGTIEYDTIAETLRIMPCFFST